MKLSNLVKVALFAIVVSILLVPSSVAQEEGQEPEQEGQQEEGTGESTEEEGLQSKKDKTGTNPINFQKELRFYNEYSFLNTAGDGNQNVSTVEIRTPFANGKWQWRIRAHPVTGLEADFNDDGVDDVDEWSLGDTDMRFLTVPIVRMDKLFAIAYGLEVFMNTASDDALGAGTTALGPQIFYGKFFKRGLFAPGLQYRFSVDEDEGRAKTDQIAIDLNLLIMAKNKLSWFFTNPQIIIDNETNQEFAIVDFEFGFMMAKFGFKAPGHSVYIRPAVGVGADRPVDYGVELGYKIIGL